ncbi:hypothetical protein Tco_1096929 [Tanacetum coccineum]
MVAWFLGLEDVLSWLLVDEKRDATTVDINAIALLRQAIGSSPVGSGMNVGNVMDDELLHKLVKMVEKNELVDELMIVVVDTKQNVTEVDG